LAAFTDFSLWNHKINYLYFSIDFQNCGFGVAASDLNLSYSKMGCAFSQRNAIEVPQSRQLIFNREVQQQQVTVTTVADNNEYVQGDDDSDDDDSDGFTDTEFSEFQRRGRLLVNESEVVQSLGPVHIHEIIPTLMTDIDSDEDDQFNDSPTLSFDIDSDEDNILDNMPIIPNLNTDINNNDD
jgi:hypothetical protein